MKRMIYAASTVNSRSNEYHEYLNTHISGVVRSWHEILRPALMADLNKFGIGYEDISAIDALVRMHDNSKYSEEEFDAYCNYFYPDATHKKDEVEFDKAWLHHQHNNTHHWNFWVVIRDNGKTDALDMPFESVCEMICDWHSFTLRDPASTAYSWWTKNKNKMILSANTVKTVESLIEYMKEPLEQS